jgi:hypothetical protein
MQGATHELSVEVPAAAEASEMPESGTLDTRTKAVLDQLMVDLVEEPAEDSKESGLGHVMVSHPAVDDHRERDAPPSVTLREAKKEEERREPVTEPPPLELQPMTAAVIVDDMEELDAEPWSEIVEAADEEPVAFADDAVPPQPPSAMDAVPQSSDETQPAAARPAAPADVRPDPLAAVRALSDDEKIALFT